jgi:hypothetical protein
VEGDEGGGGAGKQRAERASLLGRATQDGGRLQGSLIEVAAEIGQRGGGIGNRSPTMRGCLEKSPRRWES